MGSPERSTAEMRSGDGASLKMFSHICMCEGSVLEVWGSLGEEGCPFPSPFPNNYVLLIDIYSPNLHREGDREISRVAGGWLEIESTWQSVISHSTLGGF